MKGLKCYSVFCFLNLLFHNWLPDDLEMDNKNTNYLNFFTMQAQEQINPLVVL